MSAASAPAPRVLVIGGTGLVGAPVVAKLRAEGMTVLIGSRKETSDVVIDINSGDSVAKALSAFNLKNNSLNHIVVCCGDALFGKVGDIPREDYSKAFNSKCIGQIDIVQRAKDCVVDGGSVTLTSGCLDKQYIPLGVANATINGAVNHFGRMASLEMPRGLRVNVVSPGLLTEAKARYGPFFQGFKTVDGSDVALAFQRSMLGGISGKVLEVTPAAQWVEQ